MKTIILDKPGEFSFADTQAPRAPAAGEALVRVRRIGICGTDLHAFRGRQPFFTYPRILGHELGVEIAEIGPNERGLAVGDRCAVEPYLNCGHCIACQRGKTNCCTTLQVLGVHTDGGMRELLRVPIAKLYKSETLSLEQLALVETLGIGAHAVQRAQLEPGETVLVIGAGPIGLTVVQFALLAGARVIAMDISANRLAFCRAQFDVWQTLDARAEPLAQLQKLLGEELPTTVFDATGNAQSMMQALSYMANGGKLVFVGFVQGDVTFHDSEFHRREATLLRSRNSTGADFARIIQMLEQGRINVTPWISCRVPFDGMIAEFSQWLDPEANVIKAMVEL